MPFKTDLPKTINLNRSYTQTALQSRVSVRQSAQGGGEPGAAHDAAAVAEGAVPGLLDRLDVHVQVPELLPQAAHGRRRHLLRHLIGRNRDAEQTKFMRTVTTVFPPSRQAAFMCVTERLDLPE